VSCHDWRMRRWTIAVGISGLGIAAGILTLIAARDHPGYWFAGSSDLAGAALLAAGWALIGCGLATWLRRPGSRSGLLLAAAGFAWFLPEWNNPGLSSSVAFTIGLVLYVACAPFVAHAVLAYPGGRLASRVEAGAVAVAYAGGVLVLGVLPALVFDPEAEGCAPCPDNLLLLTGDARLAENVNRVGLYLGLAWAIVLAALGGVRLVRGSHATRPVMGAGIIYVLLVVATFAVSLDRGFVTNGTAERRLWLGQAAALAAVAASAAWNLARARRARSAVARLVAELTQSPPPGGLRDALARIVDDPGLVLAYPLGEAAGLVDAQGRSIELPTDREKTSLVHDGRTVAVLAHRQGLFDDEQLLEEVAAAARLALENERLQAEVRARLEELRSSRARIVEAGDAERKRLERDLHDGAQQRLVGLSLSLRLLRGRMVVGDVWAAERLEQAEAELRRAAVELRELAHGIFPAVLADEGLGAALEALAEDGRVPIRIRGVPNTRYNAPIETAAYTVVAEAARTATDTLAVAARVSADTLIIEVETRRADALDLTALEDRIGALDGRLILGPAANGGVTIRAELPCGS
jgi:signal transduction histidine kinase